MFRTSALIFRVVVCHLWHFVTIPGSEMVLLLLLLLLAERDMSFSTWISPDVYISKRERICVVLLVLLPVRSLCVEQC